MASIMVGRMHIVSLAFVLMLSSACCAVDAAGTQGDMRGSAGASLISTWASRAAGQLPGLDRTWETATELDTICEALVRIGRSDTALALYRQAFPDRERTKPDKSDLTHLTVSAQTSMLGQQLVVMLRQGKPVDDLLAECEATAEPISLAVCGQDSFRHVRWPIVVALCLGGRVEDGIGRAMALRNPDLAGWDVAGLLAAAWRCGNREPVERETVRLLTAEPSWRLPVARSRLDAGDLEGAKLLAAGLSGRDAADFREALAFLLPESARETSGLPPESRLIVAGNLIQTGKLSAAAQLMRGQPYDNTDWVSILCSFSNGDTQRVVTGFAAEGDLCERIERFNRILIGSWTGDQQQRAAHLLRREFMALRSAGGAWPWDTEQEYAYALAILSIEGEGAAITQTIQEISGSGHYYLPSCLRSSVIELTRADRIALAEDFQRRFTTGEAFELCGAWIAGAYVRAGDPTSAEAAYAALRTPGGRFEALSHMVESATLHWLGRPQAVGLNWMDAEFGL